MTLKQYQRIKLVLVVVVAFVFSQSIILKNYFVPIGTLVVSSLLLLYLRKKVKEVINDERDFMIGGKSALVAIQIYSWISALSMFVLYALRDRNPAYEPIAMTLAFSTCILMILYSLIFKYRSSVSFTSKKIWYIVFVAFFLVVFGVFTLRLFSGEDDWICDNGAWTKHGNPSFPAPTEPCP